MKNINKTININTIIYFLLLLPLFKPPCVSMISPTVDYIYKLFQIISFVGTMLLLIKKIKISKFIVILTIFQIINMLATYYNHGDLKTVFLDFIQVITMALLIETGLKRHPRNLIRAILLLFEVLITVNLITIFLYPKGMYVHPISKFTTNWFLGYDNNHIMYILPGLMLSFIYSYIDGKTIKPRTIYLLIISIISVLVRQSATSMVGFSLFALYFICNNLINKFKGFNIYLYLTTIVFANISIVIFRIQYLFKSIIVNILHKDITFTGRTIIWDNVLKFIKEKPILGYGYEDGAIRQIKYRYWGAVHTHNQLLEVTYQGGLIGLGIFVIMILTIAKELYKFKNNKISKLLSWTMFVYFFMVITEVFSIDKIIVILVFAYNVKYLIKASKKVTS